MYAINESILHLINIKYSVRVLTVSLPVLFSHSIRVDGNKLYFQVAGFFSSPASSIDVYGGEMAVLKETF